MQKNFPTPKVYNCQIWFETFQGRLIIKNNFKRSRPDTLTKESTSGLLHINMIRQTNPAIVNEKISDLLHYFMNINAH